MKGYGNGDCSRRTATLTLTLFCSYSSLTNSCCSYTKTYVYLNICIHKYIEIDLYVYTLLANVLFHMSNWRLFFKQRSYKIAIYILLRYVAFPITKLFPLKTSMNALPGCRCFNRWLFNCRLSRKIENPTWWKLSK